MKCDILICIIQSAERGRRKFRHKSLDIHLFLLMALLNLEYDTDYVKYILEEMQVNEIGKKAFLFYTLVYCVDFMGECGMQFMDKKIEADEQIVERLNRIYDLLWGEWVCLTNH